MIVKRILFVTLSSFNPNKGGIGRVTDILAKEFIDHGYEIFYLNDTYISDIHSFNSPAETFFLPNREFYSEENISFYQELIKKLNIDIVINQAGNFKQSELFLNVGNIKVKTISVLHSSPLLTYSVNKQSIFRLPNSITDFIRICYRSLRFSFDQKMYMNERMHVIDHVCRNSTKVLTLSPSFFSEIKLLTTCTDNVAAIANPNTFKVEINNLSDKKKEIVFVGRLSKSEKRADRLLKVWKNLSKQYTDWSLTIIGDGPERSNLEKYVSKNGILRVSFDGFVDPEPYYKRASILCMTSNFEGFGMVLTEAMQFGAVPIAFESFQSVKDIIIDGETGLLVKPFSLSEYSDKLSFLMSNSKERNRIAELGFDHVARFDKDNIVNEWVELFKSL